MPDLTRAIIYRGTALNNASGDPVVGHAVDSFDISQLDVRQYIEPKALQDGYDAGPLWLGGRRPAMTGTVYGTSRGDAFDKIDALNTLFEPTAAFVADPTTFGFVPLYFYDVLTPTVQRYIYVRSNGLRVVYLRDMFGGNDADPLAIPWSVTFVAKDPTIYTV